MKTFKESVQTQDFVTTANLSLTADADSAAILHQARVLSTSVDAVQVTDYVYGQVHMSPLVVAGLLIQEGIDPVLHLSCRHRNRVALIGELLGARALGVSSVLLKRGNKIPDGLRPRPKSVLDLTAKELIATAQAINVDDRFSSMPPLMLGAIATVFNSSTEWRPKEFESKIDAGAQFVQTQPCLDMEVVRRYVARLVAARLTRRIHLIVGIEVLPSADAARLLRDHRRNIVVPDAIIRRLSQARDPEAEGVTICSELLQQLAEIPGVSGANLMTPGNTETIPAAIQASGVSA